MEFERALEDLGFRPERTSRRARHHSHRATPHLTYWVQERTDGTAVFTWEFAIGEWAASRGLQVGSDEHLNSFLYPREDAVGPQDPAWLAAQIDRAEELLRSVRFLDE